MGEWRQYKLADVGWIITGKTPPTSNPDFYGGEIPFVTPTDMDGRRTINHSVRCLSELGAEKVRSSYIHKAAVVVSCIGSDMGKAALVNHPFVSNQQINSIVVSGELDRLFVYYNLSARKAEIRDKASGAAQPIMNKTDFGNLILRAPNLGLQQAISGVLGALDDKIELNRRMNETLEAMARAIFKDWFVDFGPTRAKMEGRAPYLTPKLWDLFPDALDDEDKPVGWESYALRDLAHHHRTTVSPSANPESPFEHYSIPAYDAGNEPMRDSGASIKSNKTVVPESAVLLSKLNPEIERVWLPNPKGKLRQISSTEFLAFTPLAPATRTVLFCMFKSEEFRAEMAAMVTGTSKSHQRVSPKALLSREVLVADARLLAAFDHMVSPVPRAAAIEPPRKPAPSLKRATSSSRSSCPARSASPRQRKRSKQWHDARPCQS